MKDLRKGFSMAELLIVLAIITTLTGIAVPVYSNLLEGAQHTICRANQRSIVSSYNTLAMLESWPSDKVAARQQAENLIKNQLRASFYLDESNCQAVQVNKNSGITQETAIYEYVVKNLCPAGGEYRVLLSADKQTVATFVCSAHGLSGAEVEENIGSFANSLIEPSSAMVSQIFQKKDGSISINNSDTTTGLRPGGTADYPLPAGITKVSGITVRLLEAANDVGINLGGGTWSLRRPSGDNARIVIYYTDQDISSVALGTKVDVMCYTIDYNTSGGVPVSIKTATKVPTKMAVTEKLAPTGSIFQGRYRVFAANEDQRDRGEVDPDWPAGSTP